MDNNKCTTIAVFICCFAAETCRLVIPARTNSDYLLFLVETLFLLLDSSIRGYNIKTGSITDLAPPFSFDVANVAATSANEAVIMDLRFCSSLTKVYLYGMHDCRFVFI